MMSEAKFTPGPWKALRGHAYWEVSPQVRGDGQPFTICDCCPTAPRCPDGGLQEANAHLIAAAPEMYDMLKTIENDDGSVPGWLWDRIQATLAKARGETNE